MPFFCRQQFVLFVIPTMNGSEFIELIYILLLEVKSNIGASTPVYRIWIKNSSFV
jgi:hypothetical protein